MFIREKKKKLMQHQWASQMKMTLLKLLITTWLEWTLSHLLRTQTSDVPVCLCNILIWTKSVHLHHSRKVRLMDKIIPKFCNKNPVHTVPHTKKKTIHRIVGKISNKFTAGQKWNTETCFTINRNVKSQNNRPSYKNPTKFISSFIQP